MHNKSKQMIRLRPKIRFNFRAILIVLLVFITAVNGLNVNNHSNYVNRKKVGTTSDSASENDEQLVADLSNKL